MNRTILEFNSSTEFLVKLMDCNPEDVQVMCPHCDAELLFAPTWEVARDLKVHPGIYCPKDPKHVSSMFELQPPNTDGAR